MAVQPVEPKNFPVFPVGALRDQILQDWRLELRQQINPETGQVWSEDEINRAIAPGSRWWIEANALDQAGLALQQQGLTLADQVRIDRANTVWLRDYHGWMWGLSYLPAAPGFGPATGSATPGTIYFGSTTIGDPNAFVVSDPLGQRYQCYQTFTTPGSGIVTLNFLAIDTGSKTNIPAGTILTPSANVPGGNQGAFVSTEDFTGGVDNETDAEFARRLLDYIRNKQSAGNRAQMRAWARAASSSIEDGFIFPCAMYAGSTVVAITQKRGTTVGPLARVPNLAVLSAATAYLTPPGSLEVPAHVMILVTTVNAVPTNLEMLLSMPTNSPSGWRDPKPWPVRDTNGAKVTSVVSATVFRMNADSAPPVATPKIMHWDVQTSKFVTVNVTGWTSVGGGIYEITHQSGPVLQVGDYVSPLVGRADTVASAVQSYFDGIGPGEIVAPDDDLAHRAYRYPLPTEEYPFRVGNSVLNSLSEALFPLVSDSTLAFQSQTSPAVPVDPTLGPNMLTLGGIGIYPLT